MTDVPSQEALLQPPSASWKTWLNRLGAVFGLAVVFVFFYVLEPKMASSGNIEDIARQTVIVGTTAVGMTLVIIAAGIDLSVGSIIAFTSVVVAALMKWHGFSPLAAAVGGIAAGTACGLINGLLITRLRIVPFIVTLGLMSLVRGAAKRIAHSRTVNLNPTWLSDLLSISQRYDQWHEPWSDHLPTLIILYGSKVLLGVAVVAGALYTVHRALQARSRHKAALACILALAWPIGAVVFIRYAGWGGPGASQPAAVALHAVIVLLGIAAVIGAVHLGRAILAARRGPGRYVSIALLAAGLVAGGVLFAGKAAWPGVEQPALSAAVTTVWLIVLAVAVVEGVVQLVRRFIGKADARRRRAALIGALAALALLVVGVGLAVRFIGLDVLALWLAAFGWTILLICTYAPIVLVGFATVAGWVHVLSWTLRLGLSRGAVVRVAALASLWGGGVTAIAWYAWRWSAGVWLMGAFGMLTAVMLRYTKLGRHVFAVGSNEQTARLCGVAVNWVKVFVYTMSGFAAALGGLMLLSYQDQGDPTGAGGFELDVIAAVVIGGGSFAGGEGSILGSLIGAAIIKTIRVGCDLNGWPPYVTQIVTGAIIIAAVALDRLRHRRAT